MTRFQRTFLGLELLAVGLISVPALGATPAATPAATPEVKITSFMRIGTVQQRLYLGELCGQVIHNDNTSYSIRVVADPDTSNPGPYPLITGLDGKFCVVIRTLTGTADASIMARTGQVTARAAISGE